MKGKKWSITECLFTHWPFLSIPSPFCWEPRVRSQEVSSSLFMTWPLTKEEVKLWPFSHLQMVSLLVFFFFRLLCIVYPLWVGPVIWGSIHHAHTLSEGTVLIWLTVLWSKKYKHRVWFVMSRIFLGSTFSKERSSLKWTYSVIHRGWKKQAQWDKSFITDYSYYSGLPISGTMKSNPKL